MKELLSNRVLNMSESATIKMAQKARELKAQGFDIISLSLGEPDFDTPKHIKDAAIEALNEGYTKYTPVPGLVELRTEISKKFKRENGLDYDINQIVVSNGAKQSVANLSLALLNAGDEVIVLTPYWVSYIEIIKISGGIPVQVSAGIDQDFKVTPAQLEAAITAKTKAVLFSSPCNPTGSVYTKEELEGIAKVIAKHEDILIISDEIYEYINFTNNHISIGSFDIVKDRTITINGFSKGYAMTGWRLGYIGAPLWVAKACTKIQGQFTSGATSFGQKAACTALQSSNKPTEDMKKAYLRRRNLLIEKLGSIEGIKVNQPKGAFYIFPDISAFFGKKYNGNTINSSDDFCDILLTEGHVAVVSGTAFGAPKCFRISYAASDEDLIKSVDRIKRVTEMLQ